jgi:hypothetical protein
MAITLKLFATGRKNFLLNIYSSHSIGLQNFNEIQCCHVNCCANLTQNDPLLKIEAAHSSDTPIAIPTQLQGVISQKDLI